MANPDKLGYYQVGNIKTYSKVEAIELHRSTGIHPQWIFNDQEFSSYNWQVEPVESLEELYVRRAKELRNQYDYLVLWYSGGADSSNMLDTFINNNIHIDEVLTMNYHSLDAREHSYFHAEQYKVSYPRIAELQVAGYKFKHKVVDLSKLAHSVLTDSTYRTQLAYYHNSRFGLSHISASYIRETDSDYLKLFDQGKRVAFIYGLDKPRVQLDSGRYNLRFIDIVDASIAIRTQILNRPTEFDELFYWSPDSLDIMCKQAHTVMRYMKQIQQLQAGAQRGFDFRNTETTYSLEALDRLFGPGASQRLSFKEILNWIIYPGHNPFTFTVGKPKTAVYSLRDEFWQKDIVYNQSIELAVQHLKTLPKYWWADENDITQGLKGMISPPYWLES